MQGKNSENSINAVSLKFREFMLPYRQEFRSYIVLFFAEYRTEVKMPRKIIESSVHALCCFP